jgi:hypothetical protein
MEQGPRKATDVLLDLEKKIDTLFQVVMAQDLNIKVLSNKLNMLLTAKSAATQTAPQKITAETVDIGLPISTMLSPHERQIPISSDEIIKIETTPVGFRRTSRPETYAGDNAYLNNNQPVNDIVTVAVPNKKVEPQKSQVIEQRALKPTGRSIPVQQRIVDKNGKSLFLADVEILSESKESIYQTRTNGTGKWMASLDVGKYTVIIKKKELMTKEKMEAVEEIVVDGSTSTVNLPVMIIK